VYDRIKNPDQEHNHLTCNLMTSFTWGFCWNCCIVLF